MDFADIKRSGFNAAAAERNSEIWTLQLFPTATLQDIADCIDGLQMLDDGGFLFSLARGDIRGAVFDVAVPVDGSADAKLEALGQHKQVQSVIAGKPGATLRLLHQKPGELCGLLQQAVQGHLPVMVGHTTVFGPVGPEPSSGG